MYDFETEVSESLRLACAYLKSVENLYPNLYFEVRHNIFNSIILPMECKAGKPLAGLRVPFKFILNDAMVDIVSGSLYTDEESLTIAGGIFVKEVQALHHYIQLSPRLAVANKTTLTEVEAAFMIYAKFKSIDKMIRTLPLVSVVEKVPYLIAVYFAEFYQAAPDAIVAK